MQFFNSDTIIWCF